MLAKLLALPLQPPKTKASHFPESLLKKYRCKAALQGPVSAGKWQSSVSTVDFLGATRLQKLSHCSLETKLFPLPSQPPYSKVWQRPFWGLKYHLWRLARQLPTSGFNSQTSVKKKKNWYTKKPPNLKAHLWIRALLWFGTSLSNLLRTKSCCYFHYIHRKGMSCRYCLWCRSNIWYAILCMALDPDPKCNYQIAFLDLKIAKYWSSMNFNHVLYLFRVLVVSRYHLPRKSSFGYIRIPTQNCWRSPCNHCR